MTITLALGYGLDDRGSRIRFPAGSGNFSLHHRVQKCSGVHTPSCPMDTRGSFPGLKRPGREADHSPPSSAEVKNAWSYTSTPLYVFMAWCLVKHRDNFIFTFITLRCNSYDRSVGIATRLWAGRSGFWGSIPGGGWEFFSSPSRQERLRGLRSLINGYLGLFPWG
jgi:hypothetical protein